MDVVKKRMKGKGRNGKRRETRESTRLVGIRCGRQEI